jgi:RNA polymerase sigma-70 factor (ECF subfamily)
MIKTRSGLDRGDTERDSKFPGRIGTGLESFVKNACDPLRGFLYRLIQDRSISDKLALETFVKVLRTRQTSLTENEFIISLYRTAISVASTHSGAMPSRLAVEAATLMRSPSEARLPQPAKIRHFVDELPEQQRIAVLLHKYQGLNCRQVSEVLEVNESEARLLLASAYDTLHQKLSA